MICSRVCNFTHYKVFFYQWYGNKRYVYLANIHSLDVNSFGKDYTWTRYRTALWKHSSLAWTLPFSRTITQPAPASQAVLRCAYLLSPVQLFATPWTPGPQASLSRGILQGRIQEYWVSCYALLQGIFLTQGLNPALPHYRQILYWLSHQEAGVRPNLMPRWLNLSFAALPLYGPPISVDMYHPAYYMLFPDHTVNSFWWLNLVFDD